MEIVKASELPFVETVEEQAVSANQFINANTKSVSFDQLSRQCIILVFTKDNESTISHQEFIMADQEAAHSWFTGERFLKPAVRVSHPIKGRIPDAMGKPANLLTEDEKTIHYEKMAFMIEIPSIKDSICSKTLGRNSFVFCFSTARKL